MAKKVMLTEACHRLLKVRAAEAGMTMGALVEAWLRERERPCVDVEGGSDGR